MYAGNGNGVLLQQASVQVCALGRQHTKWTSRSRTTAVIIIIVSTSAAAEALVLEAHVAQHTSATSIAVVAIVLRALAASGTREWKEPKMGARDAIEWK